MFAVDQSSEIMGVGNQESNLLKGAVGSRAPINVLTQNVQIIEGSKGDINNIKLNEQEGELLEIIIEFYRLLRGLFLYPLYGLQNI